MTGVHGPAATAGNQGRLTWLLFACVVVAAPLYQIPGIPTTLTARVQATLLFAFLLAYGIHLLGAQRVAVPTGGTSLAFGGLLAAVAATAPATSATALGLGLFARTYLLPGMFFVLMYNFVRERRDLQYVARVLIISPALMAMYAILARIAAAGDTPTVSALLVYSNAESGLTLGRTAFATTLTFALPLLLASLARSHRRGTPGWLVGAPIVGLTALVLCLTWVRSAIVAAALTVLSLLWSQSRKKAVAALLLVLAFGLFLSPRIADWMRLTSPVDVFTSGRSYLIPVAVRIIRDHPLTGVGLGCFGSYSVALLPEEGMKYGIANPHSLPVYVASESGVAAGMACCLFTLGALALAIRVLSRSRDLLASAFAAVVLSGVLLSLVSAGIIFGNFFLNLPWWIALAALSRVSQGHWYELPRGDQCDGLLVC